MTGLLCGSTCVSLNSCLFSHGEEARIKREEDEKRGKDVMSVSMPQALAPDVQLGTRLSVSFGPLSLHFSTSMQVQRPSPSTVGRRCW